MSNDFKPVTVEEAERALQADWKGYHFPLCAENIGDGKCSCGTGLMLRALRTIVEKDRAKGPSRCPWCGRVTMFHSKGVFCPDCHTYYEREGWWRVACDEAHAHVAACLVQAALPKKK